MVERRIPPAPAEIEIGLGVCGADFDEGDGGVDVSAEGELLRLSRRLEDPPLSSKLMSLFVFRSGKVVGVVF